MSFFKNLFKKNKVKHIFCELSIKGSDKYVTGLVTYLNLNQSNIKVFIYEEYLKDTFTQDAQVTIKFIRDSKQFIFGGSIKEINLSSLNQALSINIDEIKIVENYRKDDRYSYECDALVIKGDQSIVEALLCDISLGGVLIKCDNSLSGSSSIKIEIRALPNEIISFNADIAREIRTNKSFKYALRIKDIDEENKKLLNKLIVLLSKEKTKIVEELNTLNKAKIKTAMMINRRKL